MPTRSRAASRAESLAVFQTGVLYHLLHAVALAVVGVIAHRASGGVIQVAGWLFLAGIVLFSGSLYALALTGAKFFGPITPLGGLCFLGGWACLAAAALGLETP